MSLGDHVLGAPAPRVAPVALGMAMPEQYRERPVLDSLPARPLDEPELPLPPLPLLEQLVEDFATYDRNLTQPGLWAVVAHRLGASSRSESSAARKLVLEGAHRLLAGAVDLVWGIHLPREVLLGRRVRLWHSGCMYLNARAIGDDVHIRHDTTFGPLIGMGSRSDQLPVIEARVELGAGACVLGDVHVGHDSFVGANTLVIKPVPANTTVLGVPARQLPK